MQPEHHNKSTLFTLYQTHNVRHADNLLRDLCNIVTVYLQAALQRGIETLSQAEVGSALQVYFNLALLRKVPASANMHVLTHQQPRCCTNHCLYMICSACLSRLHCVAVFD